MTGYGRAVADAGGSTVSVEIRTVNHRYLDVRMRMPSGLLSQEEAARRLISERLERGRVECTVALDDGGAGERTVRLDESLLHSAVDALRAIRDALGSQEPLRVADVLAVPGLWQIDAAPTDEEALAAAVGAAVSEALDAVTSMRAVEGEALAADVAPRIQRVAKLTQQLSERVPAIVAEAHERLRERVEQLLTETSLDPERLAQEAALLADRADVSEEITRIDSHLQQLQSRIQSGGAMGRSLDFLLQELNREWNTIGSKTHDASAAHVIVQARAELEKMREQVQNIE